MEDGLSDISELFGADKVPGDYRVFANATMCRAALRSAVSQSELPGLLQKRGFGWGRSFDFREVWTRGQERLKRNDRSANTVEKNGPRPCDVVASWSVLLHANAMRQETETLLNCERPLIGVHEVRV